MSQETEKRTTICIPTFNQSQYILQAISSALAQTCPCDVFVSNDGSTDNTAMILAQTIPNKSLKIVNHSINLGIGRHINWLLQQPATPLIARLDSDDTLKPEFIEALTKLLDAHPKAGYAHCAVEEVDETGRRRKVRRLARRNGYEEADSSLRNMVFGYKVAANIILFRREALNAAGFGSEKLNFAEDYDLCVRIADAGWGNIYSDEVYASYRVWAASNRQSVSRKISEIRGLCQVYSVSLEDAFLRRGWKLRAIKWRRMELALAHSDYLSDALNEREWKSLQLELVKLAGSQLASVIFEQNGLGSWVRRTLVRFLRFRGFVRRLAKKAISHG